MSYEPKEWNVFDGAGDSRVTLGSDGYISVQTHYGLIDTLDSAEALSLAEALTCAALAKDEQDGKRVTTVDRVNAVFARHDAEANRG